VITDQDGKVLSKHDYLAYGEEITTADFQTNRMKFTGHERDPETGLDYMLARYYSSGSGRFLQVDSGYDYSKTDPMSFNLYSCVRGNPIMGTDPTGTNWFKIDGKWKWQKGSTYTYKNKDGKEQTLHSDYKYLAKFVVLSVRNGRAVGYISFQTRDNETGKLYKPWKTETLMFSGSSNSGPIFNGEYTLNLSKIVDSRKGTKLRDDNHNPVWKGGFLELLPETVTSQGVTYNMSGGWGSWRVYLNPSAEIVTKHGSKAYGNYIHGRGDKNRHFTKGCVCDPTDAVLDELYFVRRTTSFVPFVVTGSSQ